MQFEILDVFQQDSQLVVKVRHHNPDGSAWFVEHYTWQGREGLKRQRRVNALGEPLLDDGTVAPTRVVRPGPPETVEWFVPAGREWAYNNRPRMNEVDILNVIAATHKQRLITGWAQGTVDQLGSFKSTPADEVGCPVLLAHLTALKGRVL